MRIADRTLVMGIVNVTPDSFSDGGSYVDPDAAISRAYRLVREGADVVDVGGESTRPGARPLSSREEWNRIGAVVRELCKASIPVSVDTYHADTARRAADAGATIINDVTGGRGDPAMLSAVAANRCAYVLQHSRGAAQSTDSQARYANIGREVTDELGAGIDRALSAGVHADQIIVDPGFGFAKVGSNDWDLAANMEGVMALGFPVLVGVSRKRFLAEIASGEDGPEHRDDTTAALSAYFAELGVWGVRVHEVAASRAAVETVARLRRAGAYAAAKAGGPAGETAGAGGSADGIAEAGSPAVDGSGAAGDSAVDSRAADDAARADTGAAGADNGAAELASAADDDGTADGRAASASDAGLELDAASAPDAGAQSAAGQLEADAPAAEPAATAAHGGQASIDGRMSVGGQASIGVGATASDTVRIAGVQAEGYHGVYAQEKALPQPFVADVEAEVDASMAAASDHVGETISYSEIAADAVDVIEGPSVDLIETLAERIAGRVLARGALRVAVTVHKPQAPVGLAFSDASVTIRRASPIAAEGTIRRVVLALGSNLGDRRATLDAAVEEIRKLDVHVTAVSGYVASAPMLAEGQAPQGDYLNAVLSLTTAMAPLDLLGALQRIEVRLGRVRSRRWSPRTIDLDIIDVEGVTSGNPRLTLPHPRAAGRPFVLEPWLQIDAGASLAGVPVASLAAGLRAGEPGGAPASGGREAPANDGRETPDGAPANGESPDSDRPRKAPANDERKATSNDEQREASSSAGRDAGTSPQTGDPGCG